MRLSAVVAAAVLLLAACSGTQAAQTPLSSTLSEFKYSPATLQVAAGVPLRLTIRNGGSVEHDFAIDSQRIQVKLQPGESREQWIAALPAGTYAFYCTVPGHKEAGMTGRLIVR